MQASAEASSPRPAALSQYVLKVHSRCNLACDHCYVYEHADQGWRNRPRVMAPATVRAAAARIAEHAAAHQLDRVHVVLHGGEPLLLGVGRLRDVLAELRSTIDPVTGLDLRMQTNGVLLTPTVCELLADNDVKVGVSLDGDLDANDLHRRFPDGSSSHAAVLRGLALLDSPAYRRSYAGILCTVDLANDPIRVYEALLARRPPRLDFLLPHATWDRPPPHPGHDSAPYAGWLLRVWHRWVADGRPVPIRLFTSLISTGTGESSGTETVGLDPADLVVIETDGTWEQVDSLKTTFDGAAATGYDVFRHPVDEVAGHPGIARRQTGLRDLCATCRACPVVRQCGGGLFAHRYRTTNGFDNPSVYCADLKELIITIDGGPVRPVVEACPADERPGAVAGAADDPSPQALALVDQLATGYGDATSVGRLVSAQLSVTRTLLVAVAERLGTADTPAVDAWRLLLRLDHETPEAVARVLAHPFVRTWAVDRLGTAPAVADGLGHLGSLAVAAAIHSGVRVDLDVPINGAVLHLPTLGSLILDQRATGRATVSTRARGFTVRTGGRRIDIDLDSIAPPEWQAHRVVDIDGSVVSIEDTDPWRDCHDWPAASRLPDPAARVFMAAAVEAVREVRQLVPGHQPGMGAALRAIVPLRRDSTGRLRSSTARQAFGAVAVTPVPAADLAALLVHEFQHLKLWALLDLHDLVDPSRTTRIRVPWRPDSRPIEGVLQGVYAHLGVADLWRARATDPLRGDRWPDAAGLFLRYRGWTVKAVEALCNSGGLTPLGGRLVDRMVSTMDKWSVP